MMNDDNTQDTRELQSTEAEPTFIGWLWRMCIPLIPCIGFLIYIILLCVWSIGGKRSKTLRTWSRAALVAALIQTALIVVIFAAIQLSGTDLIGLVSVFVKKL